MSFTSQWDVRKIGAFTALLLQGGGEVKGPLQRALSNSLGGCRSPVLGSREDSTPDFLAGLISALN